MISVVVEIHEWILFSANWSCFTIIIGCVTRAILYNLVFTTNAVPHGSILKNIHTYIKQEKNAFFIKKIKNSLYNSMNCIDILTLKHGTFRAKNYLWSWSDLR
jgi:hypothetical protein